MRRIWTGLLLALLLRAPNLSAGGGPSPGQDKPGQQPGPLSSSRLKNAEVVRQQLGLLPGYAKLTGLRSIKVAVLDYGFEGVGSRPYLPADAVVVEHYDPEFVRRFNLGDPAFQKPFTPGNSHGRSMAQLIWAMTGHSPDGPRFYLLNANGPTLFRRAVRYAIEQKVDVILFAANFEGAGNYDGRGSINVIVDEAVSAGIIWVNAAGNSGGCVYNGPIQVDREGYVRLGSGASATALRFRNLLDENAVTVTLTWNDYTNEEDAGTDKDLDLYVEDAQGKVLGASELRQIKGDRTAGPNESRNPRERVVLSDLAAAPGREYRIRVKAVSGNFTTKDRLRILVSALRDVPFRDPQTGKITRPVQMLDASEAGEIYPPADHPGVVTVGEGTRYSSMGPTADGRVKPDVILVDSTAQFSNGEETTGSSNAAAYFAGIVVLMKAAQPALQTRHVLALARRGERPPNSPPVARAAPPRTPAVPVQGTYPSPQKVPAVRSSAPSPSQGTRSGPPAPGSATSQASAAQVVLPVRHRRDLPGALPPRTGWPNSSARCLIESGTQQSNRNVRDPPLFWEGLLTLPYRGWLLLSDRRAGGVSPLSIRGALPQGADAPRSPRTGQNFPASVPEQGRVAHLTPARDLLHEIGQERRRDMSDELKRDQDNARPGKVTPEVGEDPLGGENARGEVPGCPTGLSQPIEVPDKEGPDAEEVHGPLEVEHLEGRQEAGQDD